MKRLFWIFLMSLFLSACTTVATATPGAETFFDPNLSAAQAQLTADAAQNQAKLYSVMATGTAQAPIISITQTAADFAMQQSYAQATSTSAAQTQVAAVTITAQAWTPTPNATMTAVFAQSYADATKVANSITLSNLEIERARDTNQLRAFSLYVVGLLAVISALMFIKALAKRLAFIPNPVDERGKPLPMIDVVEGTAWDIDRASNGMLGTTKTFLKQLPVITAERQDQVTARAQMVDMTTRRARLPKRLLDEQAQQPLLAAPGSLGTNFMLPSWNLINDWDGKNGIPYYTARGLETIDTERFPHLSVLGVTGSGKSRRFIRPLITCALAAGHRVIMIGKAKDYWLFENHPNATLLKVNQLTEINEAWKYANFLKAAIAEMNRRDDVLTATHQSTWTRAGRMQTYLILDELGNAMRIMEKSNKDAANQCWAWAEGLVSEGRSVGFNIVLANQRATGMASILSQTGKAIFRVEADEEKAHRSLAGASMLSDGYFLAKFGASQLAGAFEPTDEEIQQFLASRPVNKLDDEDQWIEGVVINQPANLPEDKKEALPPPADSMTAWVNKLGEKDLKVMEMYQAGGFSIEDIQRSVWGYTNGTTVRRVKSLIEQYRQLKGLPVETTTTTTTTTPNMPNLSVMTA